MLFILMFCVVIFKYELNNTEEFFEKPYTCIVAIRGSCGIELKNFDKCISTALTNF